MPTEGKCRDTHIVLTGPMGSGKTTVGERLAHRLDRRFFDSDAQIEHEYGASARHLARVHGVDWLHQAESTALRTALTAEAPAVMAAAASIADRPDLGRLLGRGVVTVLLEGDPQVLADRARSGRHRRRVDPVAYADVTARRRERLMGHLDLALDVTDLTPAAVVEAIVDHCRTG